MSDTAHDPAAILEEARAMVAQMPNDPDWLRRGGWAADALELDEAVDWYERLTRVLPHDADAWRSLGDAKASIGDDEGAAKAFRRALELGEGDAQDLSNLAHLEHRTTQSIEAVTLLTSALEKSPGNPAILRSLIDLHLTKGQIESAMQRAEELIVIEPNDVLTLLDIADIAIQMGDHQKAAKTFETLRVVDDADGHRVIACHGIIEAHVLGQRWRPALNAAIDATAIDRHQLTTDLLVYVSSQLFGAGGGAGGAAAGAAGAGGGDEGREPRPWDDLKNELALERAEHRRHHAEQTM